MYGFSNLQPILKELNYLIAFFLQAIRAVFRPFVPIQEYKHRRRVA
jgi:hypothetical protein